MFIAQEIFEKTKIIFDIKKEKTITSQLSVKTYLKFVSSKKNTKNGENWAYFEIQTSKGRVMFYTFKY